MKMPIVQILKDLTIALAITDMKEMASIALVNQICFQGTLVFYLSYNFKIVSLDQENLRGAGIKKSFLHATLGSALGGWGTPPGLGLRH